MVSAAKRVTESERGPQATSVPRSHTGLTRIDRADRRFALLMIAPSFIAVLAIMAYPWFYSLWLSLHNMNLLTKRWTWVGTGNYTKVFQDATFGDSLIRTLWFSGLVVLGGTVLGMLMALVLNETFRGRGVMRSVMLMPWAIAPV